MRKKISDIWINQNGQTMLIVVLAVVIALTVGLSVVSRSITSLKTTTEEVNSQKALSAAEAGIERALQKLTSSSAPIEGTFDLGTTFSATISALFGKEIVLNGGNAVGKDEGIDLWLVEHSTDGTPNLTSPWSGTLDIYWGESSDECNQTEAVNTMAALEIVIISGSQASPSLVRYVVDPCPDRVSKNYFSAAEGQGTVASKLFPYSITTIPLITNGFVVRIVPIYANTPIAVVADPDLPSQGSVIDSIGKSGSTERKVTVFQGYPSLPTEYFPNNFFYHNL